MTQIVTCYRQFLQFIKYKAWSRDSSILVKGSKALRLFLNDIVSRDLERGLLDVAKRQTKVFEDTYGPIRKTIKHHWHVLEMQMDIGMRSFDRFTAQNIDRDNVLPKLNEAENVLLTLKDAVHVYFQSLAQGRPVFESNSLNLSREELEYLPSVPVLGNYTLCPDGTEQIQAPIFNALLALLRQIKDHAVSNSAPKNAPMLLKNISLSFSELKMEFQKAERCINEYADFLHSVQVWDLHVQATLEKEAASLAISDEFSNVDDVLDFVDETKPLKEFGDIVESVKKSIMGMTEPVKDTMELFGEDSISHAIQSINNFGSRVQLRLIEPLRNKLSGLKEGISKMYVELLRKDFKFSR